MIAVEAVTGVALVQDGGRPGRMHQGIPPGGALVPELLARANAAVGNRPGEAGIEVFGSIALAATTDAVRVASDEGLARSLDRGEVWRSGATGSRVRYVAVRGGLAVPEVLGGRGTLLVAGLGGHEGRALRKGDLLALGDAAERTGSVPPAPSPDSPVAVVLGPDVGRFREAAFDVLLGREYRVSPRSDRVGVRLEGPPLARVDGDDGTSAPMVRGAIQVPSSGEPIVLGPDHPTMGGYPVIATVVRASLGPLMQLPPGATVRFTTAPTPFVTKGWRGGI